MPLITIYMLSDARNPTNAKYIGITKRKLSYRLANHLLDAKSKLSKKALWINEVLKDNSSILITPIDEIQCMNSKDIHFWESYWISTFKSWNFDLKNSNNGGGGLHARDKKFSEWLSKRNIGNTYRKGKPHSEASRLAISKKHKGKKSPLKGVKFSEEHKKKLSLSKLGKISPRKGKKNSIEHNSKVSLAFSKPIIQFDLLGNLIKEWTSITNASKSLDIQISGISRAALGERKTAGKFIWIFKDTCEV